MLLPDFAAFAVAAAVFIPLERIVPVVRGRPIARKSLAADATHFLVSGVAIKAGLFALLAGIVVIGRDVVPSEIGAAVRGQPLWLQFVETVILADLIVYSVHRAFHAVPALWRYHAIHHSSEELDWMSAYRVHPVDQILTKGLSLVPLLLLGFSAEAMALFAAVYVWQSLLLHSNANIPFGPLEHLIVSPRFHHWHHANHPEALDKNFASQLSILDHLFGTAYIPERDFPARYGTETPVPKSWIGQIAFPFRRTGAVTPPARHDLHQPLERA